MQQGASPPSASWDDAAELPSRFTVHLFAGMAATVGQRSVAIQPQEPTVAGLRAALGATFPAIEALLARSAVAVDGRYAAADAFLEPGAEIAVIPPVSGG